MERTTPDKVPSSWWRIQVHNSNLTSYGYGCHELQKYVDDCYRRGWGFKVEFFDEEPPFAPKPPPKWRTDDPHQKFDRPPFIS